MSSRSRVIRDSTGREIALAGAPRHVLPTGNPAAAALFCLARDRLQGWPEPVPGEAPPAAPALPSVPRLNAHDAAASATVVARLAPDLVVDFGTCAPPFVAFAEGLQADTGIPVAIVDGRLRETPRSLRLLGRLMGAEARADALAQAFESMWSEAAAAGRGHGPRVHYAIGARGEKTARRGSIHLDLPQMLGAVNVAEVEAGDGGRVPVAAADVARWAPELILTIDADFHRDAARLPVWAEMAAVRAGRVYLAPAPVLSWLDYPPSVNRAIGLAWLAELFHGVIGRDRLAALACDFHRMFYGVDLAPATLAAALSKAGVG